MNAAETDTKSDQVYDPFADDEPENTTQGEDIFISTKRKNIIIEDSLFDDDDGFGMKKKQKCDENNLRATKSLSTSDDEDDVDLFDGEYKSFGSSPTKALGSSNLGYQMMLKMGWKQGSGLGQKGDGMTQPITVGHKTDVHGIGRSSEERRYIQASTSKRKLLPTEIQETEEVRLKRTLEGRKQDKIKQQVTDSIKVFYCELCNKQYKKIADYETHLSSYDHHHKRRFKDLNSEHRAAQKLTRQEKQKKMEEKEFKRIQDAAEAAMQASKQNASSNEDSQAETKNTISSKREIISFGFMSVQNKSV